MLLWHKNTCLSCGNTFEASSQTEAIGQQKHYAMYQYPSQYGQPYGQYYQDPVYPQGQYPPY